MLYSYMGRWPAVLPFRIIMPNGSTRTDPSSFTEEEILQAGYTRVGDMPATSGHEYVTWDGVNWVINTKTQEEIDQEQSQLVANQWHNVKKQRDEILRDFDWRYIRYHREVRLGRTPKDRIEDLDLYTQQLADITTQEDPFSIVWPAFAGDAN